MIRCTAQWVAADLSDKDSLRVRLHSVHEHVVNFTIEGHSQMLMIAAPKMYRGPSSVGLSYDDLEHLMCALQYGSEGTLEYGELVVGQGPSGVAISLSTSVVDFSVPPCVYLDSSMLGASLQLVTDIFRQQKHMSSMSLLGAKTDGSLLHKMLKKGLSDLVEATVSGDDSAFNDACRELVGLGYGSTPTGDDLIHGVVLTHHYYRSAHNLLWKPLLIPKNILSTTTAMGQHMLTIGSQGLTLEPVRNYLMSLLGGYIDSKTVYQLFRIGATTGLDIGVAALLSLRELSRQVKS